jgi:hypothetical protein
MTMQNGSLVVATVDMMGVKAGDAGYCFEVYDQGTAVQVIFENGDYCGYNSDEIPRMLRHVGESGLHYPFTSVIQLSMDYRRGWFALPFEMTRNILAGAAINSSL